MNPALLIALIQNIAIPEITAWLRSRHANGQTVDDAAILEKLQLDADAGIAVGEDWLRNHPTDN